MCTQMEITEYVEEMQHAGEDKGHCQLQREQQIDQPRENWTRVAEWYREYEEETGTMLGCD
jgi:hypothetical protein